MTISSRNGIRLSDHLSRALHLLCLLACLVDGADHVERLLGQVIVFTVKDLLEADNRVGKPDVLARDAGGRRRLGYHSFRPGP